MKYPQLKITPTEESSLGAILESNSWLHTNSKGMHRADTSKGVLPSILESHQGIIFCLWSFNVKCFHKFAPILFCKQPPPHLLDVSVPSHQLAKALTLVQLLQLPGSLLQTSDRKNLMD